MPRVLLVALIAVLVLLSLPVLVSMDGMAPCPACPGTVMLGGWGLCLAVLSLLALFLPRTQTAVRLRGTPLRPLPALSGVDRPPRSI